MALTVALAGPVAGGTKTAQAETDLGVDLVGIERGNEHPLEFAGAYENVSYAPGDSGMPGYGDVTTVGEAGERVAEWLRSSA